MKINDVFEEVFEKTGSTDGLYVEKIDGVDEIVFRGKYTNYYLLLKCLAMRMEAGDIVLNIEDVSDKIGKRDFFYKLVKSIEGGLNETN